MSTSPLNVRLSDVRYAENLDKSMETNSSPQPSNNGDSEAPVSVRDARKRFEQLSDTKSSPSKQSSIPVKRSLSSSRDRIDGSLPPPRPKKPPVQKPVTGQKNRSMSENDSEKNQMGQSSPQESCSSIVPDQEVTNSSTTSSKGKSKGSSLKKALKRGISSGGSSGGSKAANSHRDSLGAVGETATATESCDTKRHSATKKLFRRSMERKKTGVTAEHASSNGSNSSNAKENSKSTKGDASPSSASKKVSPLSSKREKGNGHSSPPSSKSKPYSPSSSPSTERHADHAPPSQRSFSDRVLLANPSKENAVHATLKRFVSEKAKAKAAAGGRPTSARAIEDKELKLNLSQGEIYNRERMNPVYYISSVQWSWQNWLSYLVMW